MHVTVTFAWSFSLNRSSPAFIVIGSLRNKRPDLSGRPPCKGVAIGAARRGARLGGERTLRVPPCCSFQSATPADRTSHRSSVVRACGRGSGKVSKGGGIVRVRGTSGRSASAARRWGRAPAPGTAARSNNSASEKTHEENAQKFFCRHAVRFCSRFESAGFP